MQSIICPKIIRYEEAPHTTTYYRYRNSDGQNLGYFSFGESMPVTATYSVFADIKSKVIDIDLREVSNAIMAYFVLNGDTAIDDIKLSKFVSKIIGQSIKLHLTKVVKTLKIKANLGYKYITDEIILLDEEVEKDLTK